MENATNDLLSRILPTGDAEDVIQQAVQTVRTHLGMDVGVLAEFVDDQYVLRALDAPHLADQYKVGDSLPLEINYCPQVVAGKLPDLINETREHPLALELPITDIVDIRAYAGVPIRTSDGQLYGMFCCISHTPKPHLNRRDMDVMRIFADLSAREVDRALRKRDLSDATHARIDAALSPDGADVHFQPIFAMNDRSLLGVEALSRFRVTPNEGPDIWFSNAARVGRQIELETAMMEKALLALPKIPKDVSLALNASPETITGGNLFDMLSASSPERLVLEVTEHVEVGDYAGLNAELARLRTCGVRLAVDDAGAGYAGLQHILQLRPDIIKLDMSLVRDIDADRARRSLVVAMRHYASETGAILVAEGIETEGELEVLRDLGVERGQGYLLGRPAPIDLLFGAEVDTREAG